jgi:MYXO-CTERM domain-containing protein
LDQTRQAVVNGRVAQQGDIHATVALVDVSGNFFCTGSLVRPDIVISAAHCFQDPDTMRWMTAQEMRVASNALNAQPAPAGQRHGVSRYVRHASYPRNDINQHPSGMGRDDDIAIVFLSDPVHSQAPVPIFPADRLDELEPRRTAIIVSGYGITDVTGQNDRSGQLHVGETPYLERSAHELLAGGNGLTDTCNGDSGGPAYVVLDGTRYLLGATSRAAHDSQGDCGDRGLYTLVPGYMDWLEAETAGAIGGPPDPPGEPEAPPPEPEPFEPEPSEPEPPPEPESPPVEPDPPPMEPEAPPVQPPEPEVVPPPVEPEATPPPMTCDEVGDGFCVAECIRVDPDCWQTAPEEPPPAATQARFTGGCAVRSAPVEPGWWWGLLLLGLRRRA